MNQYELDTPCILVDYSKLLANIHRYQQIADDAGVALRPHVKTHKTPQIAHLQVEAGAVGITVAKLGEAEVMADAGIRNIVIAYPIVGEAKLERLIRLAKRVELAVACDSYEVAAGISEAAIKAGIVIKMWVEIDPGYGRVGVQPGENLLRLAESLAPLQGIRVTGVLEFAGHSYDAETDDQRKEVAVREAEAAESAADVLRGCGFPVETVSGGSTPVSRFASLMEGVTEIRPGTYVFGDLTQVKAGALDLGQCALTVLATVISRPAPDRAVIDGGTKVFTMDGEDSVIGTGRGFVVGHPDIKVAWFNEEHGVLTLPPSEQGLKVGDKLEIIPVHCCAVVNMLDELNIVQDGQVKDTWTIAARGKVK
ncbi:alanine racemase [Paenibacillus sp. HN-1]|uniref:alanine racemase n=1 Tax=Paenibacillus TaxID=44249 RepID=UPI001CAA32D6|nr:MULTISPECIES: alanine racemase [Paenibacillus]MBY9078216.1 alanine racemase [Paenibacillus sp. CGMCC 1.18879]MBY9086125.1 alanine racemase [Paenibacillus sinensis]